MRMPRWLIVGGVGCVGLLLLVLVLFVGIVIGSLSEGPSTGDTESPSPGADRPDESAAGRSRTAQEPERTRERAREQAPSEELAQEEPSAPAPEEANRGPNVQVTRVIDGDTIEISPAIDGIEDVRLIGVDTPETNEPGCQPQPYGAEATSYAQSALSGKVVTLEFDQERTDQYDRLLAYVYLPSREMFNEDLVEEGYAQAYPYPPNTRYEDRLASAQEEARTAGLGIWALGADQLALLTDRGNGVGGNGCTQAAPEPEPAPQYEPTPTPAPTREAPAAPTPPGGDVDCSDFSSSAEAQPYLLPGDPYRLDADGDGQACDSL